MKYILSFILCCLTTTKILSQIHPRFNALVDINKAKTIGEVFTKLKRVNYFNGFLKIDSIRHDTIIQGVYQKQNILITKLKREIDSPDSAFTVVLTFRNKNEFETFLFAGRQFFTQSGSDYEYDKEPNEYCEKEIFTKRDFKRFPMDITFKTYTSEAKTNRYELTFKPYRLSECGIK